MKYCDICHAEIVHSTPYYNLWENRWRVNFHFSRELCEGKDGFVAHPVNQELSARGYWFCSPEHLSEWLVGNGERLKYTPLANLPVSEKK